MDTQKNYEIDVFGIIKKMIKEWKLLLSFIVVAAVVGVIVALNTPKTYTTTVVLAPEFSNGGSLPEGLSSIASMVGVSIGNNAQNGVDAIYPQIYPDVLMSSDFIVNLFGVEVQQEDEDIRKSYYKHLLEDVKVPFWNYPMIWISQLLSTPDDTIHNAKELNSFSLTKKQSKVLDMVRASMSCIVDKNTSVISISVTDFDRKVSAIMADTVQRRLREYITVYRTQKARNDLEYTEKLYKESRAEYICAQQKYSSYADSNEDLWLESFKAKRDELENEMQLRYNIYTQISQQLQLAKAKVQERTPVFSVIQGATIPIKASSMPRSFIVLIYMFLGILADMLWILYLRNFVKRQKVFKKNK